MMKRIRWLRKELDYDIGSIAWLAFDAHEELPNHRRHQLADICEGENRNLVSRHLEEAYATLCILLQGIGREPHCHAASDRLRERREFVFLITSSAVKVAPVVERGHRFLIARVLAVWLAPWAPQEAAIWKAEAEEMRDALASLAARSSGHATARRPLSPF